MKSTKSTKMDKIERSQPKLIIGEVDEFDSKDEIYEQIRLSG